MNLILSPEQVRAELRGSSEKICITRDIDGIERVEKIVSLNPDRYEWRDLYLMLNQYAEWCLFLGHKGESCVSKTFKEWLTSEI